MFQEYWTTECSARDKVSSNWCCDGSELFCCQLLKLYVFILCPEVKGFTPGPPLADSIRSFTPEQITAGWHHPNKHTWKVCLQPLMSAGATRVSESFLNRLPWLCYRVFQHNNLFFSYIPLFILPMTQWYFIIFNDTFVLVQPILSLFLYRLL